MGIISKLEVVKQIISISSSLRSSQTVLPDRARLIRQKSVENSKIENSKLKCDLFLVIFKRCAKLRFFFFLMKTQWLTDDVQCSALDLNQKFESYTKFKLF